MLLKEQEVATRLAVSVKTLRRWRWAGRGPHYLKIGAAVRYDPEELSRFLEAGRRSSTADPGVVP